MNQGIEIHFSIITPGGLIIRQDLHQTPKPLQDIFRKVEVPTTMLLEEAVAYLSRLTGCICTVHRHEQITCEANYQLFPK